MKNRNGFFLALALLLAGCGNNPIGGGEDSPTPLEETAAPTAAPAASPTPGGDDDATDTGDDDSSLEASSPTPVEAQTQPPATDTPPPASDLDGDGYSEEQDDCDDGNDAVYPGARELEDGLDNDCDGKVDDGTDVYDDDRDGYSEDDGDCDDREDDVYPGAEEIAYDDVDQDCSGEDLTDVDGDGYDKDEGDCDDRNVQVYPGATEAGDQIDNDCDGKVDENLDTADDDGDGKSEAKGDCNDGDDTIYPGADEVAYDAIDQDCSGSDLNDVDEDGVIASKAGGSDCDDQDADVYPGADETYNDVDDDCNGTIDDGTVNYDDDSDGFSEAQGDCDDDDALTYPGAKETCNGLDDDCDGIIDDGAEITYYLDGDADGYGLSASSTQACARPTGYATKAGDCDDEDAAVHPNASETCNSLDDDCDSKIDEGAPTATWYDDFDQDGYGDSATAIIVCAQPEGYVSQGGDCDDADDSVHPGAVELCDGVDNDCDSGVDEGLECNLIACEADGDDLEVTISGPISKTLFGYSSSTSLSGATIGLQQWDIGSAVTTAFEGDYQDYVLDTRSDRMTPFITTASGVQYWVRLADYKASGDCEIVDDGSGGLVLATK
ncbi:hypothetical protein HY734_03340 [Candidatus Uhrbacteria bacterium]|nr:hypothetical protein [Candidatus Uhrbacteria bacterium]